MKASKSRKSQEKILTVFYLSGTQNSDLIVTYFVLDFTTGKTWITTSTECNKESEEHKYLESRNQRLTSSTNYDL